MNKFQHIISLGHDCSVAIELEKNGLRDSSYPFDWITCIEISQVINLIENNFKSFLKFDYLYQDKQRNNVYLNKKYNIKFFHDFVKYESLSDQLPKVNNKYQRRIDRFYCNIQEPTLFVRYVNRTSELKYIEDNLVRIKETLKKSNKNNEIIFLSNDDFQSSIVKLYKIKTAITNAGNTIFLNTNKEIHSKMNKNSYYSLVKRKANYKIFKRKNRFKFLKRIFNKIKRLYSKYTLKVYNHNKQFNNKKI